MTLDLDSATSEWAIEYPSLLSVFEELGIDYTCGGKSLGYACLQKGLDPQRVMNQLEDRLADNDKGSCEL